MGKLNSAFPGESRPGGATTAASSLPGKNWNLANVTRSQGRCHKPMIDLQSTWMDFPATLHAANITGSQRYA